MGTIRTLLALAVVFAHLAWHDGRVFVGGANAVRLFYVISGFLIAHILSTNPAYATPGRFYLNRGLRLFPVYFTVAALALGTHAVLRDGWFHLYRTIPAGAAWCLAVSNVTLLGQDWMMFTGIRDGRFAFFRDFSLSEIPLHRGLLVPQAWTLGVEISFYLVAPFILRDLRKLLGLLAASVCLRAWLLAAGPGWHDPWTYRFFPAELALFLAGALSQRFMLPRWSALVAGSTRRPEVVATGVLVLAITTYSFLPLPEVLKGGLLFAGFLALLPGAFLFQNRRPLDKWIGNLSYPVYIGHLLVNDLLGRAGAAAGQPGPGLLALANVLATLGFAVALNRWVADPVERLRRRLGSAVPSVPAPR